MAEILIIDDDQAVARLLKATLAPVFSVEHCSDTVSALVLLRAGARFKAILCDVHLPDCDGAQSHALIQAIEPAQAGRLLFNTGGISDADLLERIQATGCPVLYKPYRSEALIQALKDLLASD